MVNKDRTGNPDRDRINIHEYYEVEYWAKTLNISPEVLKKAVGAAGTSAVDVKKYLNK